MVTTLSTQGRLNIVARFLQYLDLVSIRIRREEESSHRRPGQRLDLAGCVSHSQQLRALRLQIVRAECHVPVSRSVRIGLGLPLVQSQLNLEAALGLTQI